MLLTYDTLNLLIIRNVTSMKLSSSNESASSRTTCDNLDKSYSSTQHNYNGNTHLIYYMNVKLY